MSIKKIVFGLAAVALLFGLSGTVSAQTVDINALLQQIALLQSQIAALSGTPAAGACTFTGNLTIGSSGAEVTCLQNYLIAGGYSIPAGATGFFGPQTQSAVAAWQRANAISPAAGYFGSISRSAYASMAGGVMPGPGPVASGPCTGGATFNYMTGALCSAATNLPAGCQAGDLFSRTTGQSCTTTPAPGTTPPPAADTGLVTTSISLESSPASGTDVTRNRPNVSTDIVRWKIKATNSAGVLKQFGIRASHRPWLYWSKAALVVDGNVIAERSGLTSADFSEVTSGSDYRLVFSGLDLSLPKDKEVFVILRVNSSTDSGRAAVNGLTIDQVSNSIVVADAENTGYTVSDGDGTDRTYDFIAASTGNIVPSTNSATPGERWIKVSESGTTPLVTLYVFDLKAEQRDATITGLTIGASTTADDNTSEQFSSVDLYEGSCPTDGSITGCTLIAGGSAGSANGNAAASASSTYAFTNLTVKIPKETKKTFTLKALYADEDDFTADAGSIASTTVFVSQTTIAGHDDNVDTLTVSGSNVSSPGVHAILRAPTLSNQSMTFTQSNPEYIAMIKAVFSLKADGGSLYVSKTTNTVFGTSSTASSTFNNNSGGLRTITGDSCSYCGDTATEFVIPDGTTRTFTADGSISNRDTNNNSTAGVATVRQFKITDIYFDTDTTNLNDFRFDQAFNGMSVFDKSVLMDVTDRN